MIVLQKTSVFFKDFSLWNNPTRTAKYEKKKSILEIQKHKKNRNYEICLQMDKGRRFVSGFAKLCEVYLKKLSYSQGNESQ